MKIAIIDDNKLFLKSWEKKLERHAYVATFTHPMEFLRFVSDNKEDGSSFDLIIVDQLSPGYDSLEDKFAQSFLKQIPNYLGKIVLCSVLYSDSQKGQDGFCAVIPKKAKSLTELIRTIRKFEI